jgi:6-phosphogluconolactonase
VRFLQALLCSVLLLLSLACGFTQSGSDNHESSSTGNSTGTTSTSHSSAEYLYSANGLTPAAGSGSISAFQISASTGSLTAVPGSPFDSGLRPYNLATDLGRNLYLANVTDEMNLRVLPIAAATGALASPHISEFAGATYEDEASCCAGPVAVDKGGRFFYVGNTENNTVDAYAIDPTTKALAQFGSVRLLEGHFPSQLVFDADQKFLFVLTDAGAPTSLLYVFWRESYQGDLTLAAGPYSFSVASQIAVSADNRFVYVAENVTNAAVLHVLAIEADGSLKEASSATAAFGAQAMAVDPLGRRIAVAGNNFVELFEVNVDGSLTTLGHGATIGEGWTFPSLAFDVTGQFLYLNSDVSDKILGFRVDESTKSLFGIPGSPWATGQQPHSLLVVVPK